MNNQIFLRDDQNDVKVILCEYYFFVRKVLLLFFFISNILEVIELEANSVVIFFLILFSEIILLCFEYNSANKYKIYYEYRKLIQ